MVLTHARVVKEAITIAVGRFMWKVAGLSLSMVAMIARSCQRCSAQQSRFLAIGSRSHPVSGENPLERRLVYRLSG